MTITEKTTFERIHYLYSRDDNRFLTLRKQKFANTSENEVWEALTSSKAVEEADLTVRDLGECKAFEKVTADSVVGVITENFSPSKFDLWFIKTVLNNSYIRHNLIKYNGMGAYYAEVITDLFEKTLRNISKEDRWGEGKASFLKCVEFFTSRNLPIESVLPAFPCKSPNPEKVASCYPDMAEELAIKRIIEFVQAVQKVYPPGMKFYLVSDGHVFSDCIHVDDDMVDLYFKKLEALYHRVKPREFDGIIFRGLNDCFRSTENEFIADLLREVDVDHHIPTQLDKETEFNRKVLMLGCDDNADLLRKQIKTPNHPRLYLYRGFSKFMCEDLAKTEIAKAVLKKKYKKLILAVAFEMIRRNDAYSNLVELIFPFHLRFSIHAHHNAGPKFGIRLLDPAICTVAGHDQNEEDRLLHIPTPWHNSIFKMENSEKFIVSPSRLADELDANEKVEGGWNEEQRLFLYRYI